MSKRNLLLSAVIMLGLAAMPCDMFADQTDAATNDQGSIHYHCSSEANCFSEVRGTTSEEGWEIILPGKAKRAPSSSCYHERDMLSFESGTSTERTLFTVAPLTEVVKDESNNNFLKTFAAGDDLPEGWDVGLSEEQIDLLKEISARSSIVECEGYEGLQLYLPPRVASLLGNTKHVLCEILHWVHSLGRERRFWNYYQPVYVTVKFIETDRNAYFMLRGSKEDDNNDTFFNSFKIVK